jgi:tRNA A-37 threonylcarbamoyl transferase component Bud32/tetratricopeptide (TPR) repeat protein
MPAIAELSVTDWHRLNGLLEQALELEESQRTAWLSALPVEATHLKPLLAQLLADARATGFDGTSQTLQPVALAAAAIAAMRREAPGDRLGPWRLERLLAEGGMGAVWQAERADGVMQRRAALKLPRAEWVDRGLAERIARERAILARLTHPAIAVLYDAGLAEGGRPYLALEYVDGVPIDAHCKGRDLASILRLVVQVVRAVAYAHGQLVIHRDLKPANVLVTASGLPKLLDFGISKIIEGDATTADATALTRLAGRPMTLAYAAPEQVLALPIGVTADVYALGVMLFELATEARLYRAATPRELEAELLRGDPRVPSAAATDKQRARQLRGDLDAIIATALKRNPAERYQSAAALADDLENYLAGQPVKAQPDSRAYRFAKFIGRHRLPMAAAAAVLLALGLGLGLALWQGNVARRQAEEARNQAERATALNTFVLSLIREFDPRASQATKAADLGLLASIERRIDAEFKGSADQLLQLRVTVGDAYKERGEVWAARRVYQRAIGEAETALPANHLGLLQAKVAKAFFVIADDEALESIDTTIERLRQSGPAGSEALIDALVARMSFVKSFGRRPGVTWDSLYVDSREAYDLATRHFGAGSANQLRAAGNLSDTLIRFAGSSRPENDRVDEAFNVIETSLEAARSNPAVAEGHTDLLRAETMFGVLLCRFRSSDDAIRKFWDVAGMARTYHGDNSVELELVFQKLADCLLYECGDLEGVRMMARTYRMAAARAEPSPWVLTYLARNVARPQCDAGKAADCEDFTTKVLVHAAAIPEEKPRSGFIAQIRPLQVRALILQGRPEEAEALAARYLIEPLCCGEFLHVFRSEALRLSGRVDEALHAAEQGISMARANGRAAGQLTWMLAQRGLAELEAKNPAQALASADEAMPLLSDTAPWEIDRGVVPLAYGRALLANGRAAEALEPLRQSYGFWLGHDPKSVWAAEAEYWFGQAWIANGDAKRGRWMVAEAKRALAKSPFKLHRRLAAGASKVTAAAAPSSR